MKATHRNGEPPNLLKMAVNSNHFLTNPNAKVEKKVISNLSKCYAMGEITVEG